MADSSQSKKADPNNLQANKTEPSNISVSDYIQNKMDKRESQDLRVEFREEMVNKKNKDPE